MFIPMVRRVLAALVLTALVLTASTGIAQQQGPSKETARKVLSLVKDANTQFDEGKFEAALSNYEQAYELYPEAVLLYRMGLAAEKAGKTRQALDYYAKFVEAMPEDDTAKKVAERITELRATVPPVVEIVTKPEGATVYADKAQTKELGKTPLKFEAQPGEHTYFVKLDGYLVARPEVSLEHAEIEQVSLELQRMSSRADRVDLRQEPEPQSEGSALATWGYVATGTGIALLGTGAVFTSLSHARAEEVNTYDKSAPGASREELDALKTEATNLHETSVPMYIAGSLVTATGVTLLLVHYLGSSEEGQAMNFQIAPAPGGAVVGLSGSF